MVSAARHKSTFASAISASVVVVVVDERKSVEDDGVGALMLRRPMEEVATDAGVEKAATEAAELSHKQERKVRVIIFVVGL